MKQLHSVPWAQSAVDVAAEVGMHAVAIAIVAAEVVVVVDMTGWENLAVVVPSSYLHQLEVHRMD